MDRTIEAHATLTVVEERIRELWCFRAWFRRYPWATKVGDRRGLNTELRALVRLLRKARRLALAAQERNDPMTFAKHDPDLAQGDHFVGMPS